MDLAQKARGLAIADPTGNPKKAPLHFVVDQNLHRCIITYNCSAHAQFFKVRGSSLNENEGVVEMKLYKSYGY